MATTKRKSSSKQVDRTATKTGASRKKESQKNPPSRSEKERSPTKSETKSGAVLALLNKPNGATIADMTGATGWQPHSVRGFLSGALKKKQGLTIKSERGEDGQRRYRIAS